MNAFALEDSRSMQSFEGCMNAFALEDSRHCRSIEDLKQTQVRLTKTRQTLKLLKDENFTKTARISDLSKRWNDERRGRTNHHVS